MINVSSRHLSWINCRCFNYSSRSWPAETGLKTVMSVVLSPGFTPPAS
jgi:hypothetical protein